MRRKPYGRTGKEISVVSFGGMRFEHPEDVDANAEVVTHAFRRGMNYFDTAPGYHGGKSEEIFGAAFAHLPREEFYVSTKSMAADAGGLREDLETSLERMKLQRIDFFHIWCLVHPRQWAERKAGGAVDAALKARDEGLIGHLVVSAHLSGPEICAVLDEGVFEGLTVGYCALNFPYRGEALSCAAGHGLGVVTMNPLGGGLIPANADRLDFLKGADDRTVVEAAIRFNVSQDAITSALVGCTTVDHVDQAVDAVEGFTAYGPEHVERVKRQVDVSFDGFCTMCGYCLPCPADVEISKLMEAYNWKILGEGDAGIRDRLKWHWDLAPDAAAACVECGECEERCTQHLPIRERLKHIAGLDA